MSIFPVFSALQQASERILTISLLSERPIAAGVENWQNKNKYLALAVRKRNSQGRDRERRKKSVGLEFAHPPALVSYVAHSRVENNVGCDGEEGGFDPHCIKGSHNSGGLWQHYAWKIPRMTLILKQQIMLEMPLCLALLPLISDMHKATNVMKKGYYLLHQQEIQSQRRMQRAICNTHLMLHREAMTGWEIFPEWEGYNKTKK